MSNPSSPISDAIVTVASITGEFHAPVLLQPPRKFPAPCWNQDETTALINAYKDKWYALRCRNLRSADWDSVASDLSSRCPTSTPNPKTSAQCRHKMEKLRKRYRTERQRSLNHPNPFFSSSWSFYDLMDSMETGSGSGSASKKHPDFNTPKFKIKNHASSLGFDDATRFDRHIDAEEEQHQHPPRYGRFLGANDSSSSIVRSIRMMGEGFVKMEKMKLDMVREIERMRMETDMKRSELILESQQLIVNAFVQGSRKNKAKKVKLVK